VFHQLDAGRAAWRLDHPRHPFGLRVSSSRGIADRLPFVGAT
jgi:hypothetical protein